MKNIILLILVLFASHFSLKAQNDTLYFRHFNVGQGLSHRNVSSIIQDSLGFMWYGTKEGLSLYDGYKFTPFKHDPKSKNSLISDDISCLAVENSGIIWIGTRMKGINRFNPYTNNFEHFQHHDNNPTTISDDRISCLLYDSIHQIIWMGTANGLNAYNLKTGKITIYKTANCAISHDKITYITIDKKNWIWIGTDGGGVNVFDLKTNKFSSYIYGNHSVSSNIINGVFADKENNIWMATPNGLNRYNQATKEFTLYKHDEKNKYSISSDNVTSVYQDRYGKIWAGTAHDGLCVYYPSENKFFVYNNEPNEKNSLSSSHINTISQGRSGMFWAATSDGGLNAFNPKTLPFNLLKVFSQNNTENLNEKISCLYYDHKQSLLIGTVDKGLYLYNMNTKKNKKIEGVNNFINCIYEYQTHVLIGTNSGIYNYDIVSSKVKISEYTKKLYAENEKITCIFCDKENSLWLGTKDKGVFKVNAINDTYIQYHTRGKGDMHLSHDHVTSILQTKNGDIWIGTYGGGLNKYDRKTNAFQVYKNDENNSNSIGGNYINKLYEDRDDKLWICTWGGGLNCLLPNSTRFICYTDHDGLPGNSIREIMQDEKNNFWINGDNGICRLTFSNTQLQQCRVFDLIDGLPTTEFYDGTALKSVNGRMMFSCPKGLITFHPDSIKNNPYKPPVIITDFQLFNNSIQPGDSTGILQSCISTTPKLNLAYNQNSFSFEFTAISFINPGKNKYAYMLEGFDKDWNYRDARHRAATYTNLDPGTYTFRVKASNNDGIWNEKGTSIIIVIAAPFWKTWWFYLLSVLAVAVIIYIAYFIRIKQLIAIQNIRNKISQDLHDEIGSALSSISVYGEVAKKMSNDKAPDAIPILNNLQYTVKSAMENMSDIVWAINPKNDKFHNITHRLEIFGTELLSAKDINFNFNIPHDLAYLKLSMQQRKNIYLICKEALNNVAKYSDAQNCSVEILKADKNVSISIVDDGKGIDNMKQSLGGNGMHNMKKRALELRGILDVFSEKNKGTKLSFTFIL